MAQDATETVVTTSFLGTIRVFVVLIVGLLASKLPRDEPLLTKETIRSISRVCTLLCLPALVIASTGGTLTPSALGDAWQLILSASVTIVCSNATAWLFGRVFLRREDHDAFLPVRVAIAFPNSAAFPLLLMEALCEQDAIKSDFDDDADECFTQATGMIFIYVAVWQIWFYAWGFIALERDDTLELKLAGHSACTSTAGVEVTSTPEHPNVWSQTGGALSISSTQKTAAIDIEREDTAVALTVVPACSHVANTRELALCSNGDGTLHAVEPERGESSGVVSDQERCTGEPTAPVVGLDAAAGGTCGGSWEARRRRVREVLVSPNIIAVCTGIVIAFISPLQEMLFDNPQAALRPLGAAIETVGTPTVAVSTLVMAASLTQVPAVGPATADAQESWRRYRYSMGALLVVCRLIVVPAAGFALFWVASTKSSVMGENKLMHLVLLIEFAMPSAALIIVSLNQLRMPATAGFMARLYLVQYSMSMFTISAWAALAVRMVY